MVKAYANNGMAQPISDTVQIERVSSVPNPTEVLGIRELEIANTSFVDLEPISLSVEGKYITATQIIVNSGSLYLAETDGVTPPTNSMSTEVAEGSIISLYTDPAKVFLKAKTATADIVIKYLSGNKGAEIGSSGGSATSNLAKEAKQDTQILETQTLNSNLGTKADAAASSDTEASSLISLIKRALQNWTTFLDRMPSKGQDVAANSLPVVLPSAQITAITPPTSVSVNNLPAIQPISTAFLPLPSGASTLTEQQTQTSAQQRIRDAIEKTVATGAGKTPVIGAFSPAEPPAIFQPISSDVFEPIAGRDFNIQVIFDAGVTGNVQLEQSLDGTNFYPPTGSGVAIMRFSSNSVEQWSNSEVGAKFRLSCTAIAGGTINYRISQ